jgi:hypothetical protein
LGEFLPFGDCLLWAVFLNTKVAQNVWATFFYGKSGAPINFNKNVLG